MIDVPVLVKDALRDGRRLKNYKINVMQDDGITLDFVIDNNSLVSESVIFDERMSSGKDLVFGLCEGASIEFQYFDHPSILGRRIQVLIDVQYQTVNNELSWYEIPIGWFDVDACPRQASTGIRKVTAYNKLKSDYLDQKANEILLSNLDDATVDLTVYSIRNTLLNDFEIEPYEYTTQETWSSWSAFPTVVTSSVKLSDLVSDDGPINYYELESAASAYGITLNTNTTLGIQIRSAIGLWNIYSYSDGYYRFIEQKAHDFGILEANFAEYLKDFFDSSPLNKSGTQLINGIKNNQDGWKRLFGIYTSGTSSKAYNDYAYRYQNDGSVKVDGSVSDIMKHLFSKADTSSLLQLIYSVPQHIEITVSLSGGTYGVLANFNILGDGSISYEGYRGTKTYPKFHYEDDTPIPDIENPFSSWFGFYRVYGLTNADLVTLSPDEMPDFTLRDLTSAVYETVCQYGRLDRVTDLFAGIELNRSQLLPQDTLYPATDLYPGGPSFSAARSTYSKLWADEDNVQKFRYLIITYKGLDGDNKEKEFTLQRTVNPDGTQDYYCSDNWLFKNLVWTANDIGAYADAMVAKMQDIRWFPFEMWCAGLPYLETGDAIEIPMGEDSYTSYILQRNLNGIQNLQDTFINGTLDIF